MNAKLATLALTVIASGLTIGTFAKTPSFDDFNMRAEAGERMTVAFFGGSLTWGARATDPQKTSYRAIIGRKLEEAYPKAHFKFVDAAIGGSGAQLGAFRLQRDVLAYKPDLVFLDFTLNDGVYETTPDKLAAYESLVRRMIADGNCPVVQMFLAARSFVAEGSTDKMKNYQAHMEIAKAYDTAIGDAIILMQRRYKEGQLDLDKIWPPESFDTCHPDDPGYALYAEAGWTAFQKAVEEKRECSLPVKMINSETYMHWNRVVISSLAPLPQGWRVSFPNRLAIAFDFMMSRWLNDVSVAANFTEPSRDKTVPAEAALPLKLKFNGSSVLLFGESTQRSCKYKVVIDGKASREFDPAGVAKACGGNTPLWNVVAEGLDPALEHTLEIQPLFESPEKPQELRLESICVAGGEARVWRSDE